MALERFKKIEPQKRQRLLQAAAQEFASAGFQKASLGRIAEGAGVSKPALYYYFEDKGDLFVTVVREAWEKLSPGKLDLATLDAESYWPSLEKLRDDNLAQCREEPWLVAVGRLAYSPPKDAKPAGAVAEMFEGARAFLLAVLRLGQELGTVRADLPEDLLVVMLTAADTAADHWMVDHWDELGTEEAERIARTVFEAVRALLSPAPGTAGGGVGVTSASLPARDDRIVFEARGLTKIYDMGAVQVHALRGVDLDLVEGELVVLLGPSGSGKSTLLNILGGLDTPTAGHVVYRGRDLHAAGEAELTAYRRRHVGFVFQFYNLIPSLTARENVALVTEIVEKPMRPEEALEIVNLGARLDHFPAQLSGGEQQRVAIARAIAKRPEVLLCDEPTGALDISTGVVVLEAIERVNRELGTCTAVITHNAAIAAMSNRVIRLSDGHIAGIESTPVQRPPRELSW